MLKKIIFSVMLGIILFAFIEIFSLV